MPITPGAIKLFIAGKINAIVIFLAAVVFSGSVSYIPHTPSLTEAAVETTKLLLDPGPRHRCYQYQDLGTNHSHISKAPDCQAVQGYGGCPTWRYSSYKAKQGHRDLLIDRNGLLIGVLLINNASEVARNSSEVSLDYYYPGCSIQKLTNETQYNLLDFDTWMFEYDVTIQAAETTPVTDITNGSRLSNATAPETRSRRYLRTEFIYQYPDPACSARNSTIASNTSNIAAFSNTTCAPLQSTISITHFDTALPSNITRSPSNNTSHNTSALQLLSTQTIKPSSRTHISLDFGSIYRQFSTQLCHGTTSTPWLNAHMFRVVSGAQGVDSVIEVGNVSAVLRKRKEADKDRSGRYRILDQPKSCPNVNVTTTGALVVEAGKVGGRDGTGNRIWEGRNMTVVRPRLRGRRFFA